MISMTIQQFLDLSAAQRAVLKELNINGILGDKLVGLNIAEMQQFANALQDCQQLQKLNLVGNNIGGLDTHRLSIFSNALQRCLQIQSLNLSYNNLGTLDLLRLIILGSALQGCSQLQSLNLVGNNLRALDAPRLSILGDASQHYAQQPQTPDSNSNNLRILDDHRLSILSYILQHCSQLQSVSLEWNNLDRREPEFIDSILLNPSVFIINSKNSLSEPQRQTLKKHYLNSISKRAYQRSSLLLQPWQNGRKLPNELLRAVIEFEKTDGLLTPDYPVSKAEIDAAFEKGFKRAEEVRILKDKQSSSVDAQPSPSLIFSASADAASGLSAKKRQRNSQQVVRSSAKKHRPTKPKQVAEGRIMISEDGQQVKRSCRLLNRKKRKF